MFIDLGRPAFRHRMDRGPRGGGGRVLLPLLAVLLFVPNARAAEPLNPRTVQFDRISIEQGLSQSVVTAILQDSRGFLWFGTQDGLNRYDGYRFQVYRNVPGDPGSLSCNYVKALWEDRQGCLWVGTRGGGLNRYDRRTGRFVAFRHDPRTDQGPADDSVMHIVGTRDGRMLICSNGGLNRFDPRTGRWERLGPKLGRLPGNYPTTSAVQAMEDRRGSIWVATYGGGVMRLDPGQSEFTVYRAAPSVPGSLPKNEALCVCEDSRGVVWVGTDEGGLSRFDPSSGTFTTYTYGSGASGSFQGNVVLAICEDREGHFWVGTDRGLHLFDRGTGRSVAFQYDPRLPKSISCNYINTIVQDRAGLLWVGTWSGGVNKYNGTPKSFNVWRQDPYDPGSLSEDGVNAVLKDRRGRLWAGLDGGLARLDSPAGKWTLYSKEFQRPGTIRPDRIVSLLEDREGTLWVGTWGGGLFFLDDRTQKFARVGKERTAPEDISQELVFTMREGKDGALWLGLYGGGLARFDPKSGACTRFRSNRSDAFALSSDLVVALHEDRAGLLWVGTMSGGLNRLDPRTGRFTIWRQNVADPRGLGSNTVWCIMENRRGQMWIGTGGGGLACFDRATGRFSSLRTADGLPNDVVYGILEDRFGHLWCSTNDGLVRFDPVRRTFRTYDSSDGLPSDEFNQNAYGRAETGEMIFGTITGLVAFFPCLIKDNTVAPPVVVTGLRKFNREVDLGGEISEQKEIVLAPEDSVFSIEYAALSYAFPEKTLYMYKLEGFDKDWIPAGNTRSATYTNLDPGRYVFRVRGANEDGVWNQAGASVHVVVSPPYWRTWWFRLLIAVVVVVAIASGFALRIHSLKSMEAGLERTVDERTEELACKSEELRAANRELEAEIAERRRFEEELARANEKLSESNDKLQNLDRMKTDFLNMAAHEIRTPLTSVLGFAKLTQKKFTGVMVPSISWEDRAAAKAALLIEENLEIIIQEAGRLTTLINDLLDVAKLEAGKMEWDFRRLSAADLIERAMSTLDSLVCGKGLRFVRKIEPDTLTVWGDRDRLLQVLINLISNALKFTEEGAITCSAVAISEGTRFSVADTGVGIAPEHIDMIFEKFHQIGDTLTEKPRGTGLGLAICRQIVEQHGGRIGVESELGKGSTFYFIIPYSPV